MLKGLKGLFVYHKPSGAEFEFAEDPSESEVWNQYKGNKKNDIQPQNEESENNDQNQLDVQNKLFQILKNSQKQQESESDSEKNKKSGDGDEDNNSKKNYENTDKSTNEDSRSSGQINENSQENSSTDNQTEDDSNRDQSNNNQKDNKKSSNKEDKGSKQSTENKEGKGGKAEKEGDQRRKFRALQVITPLHLGKLVENKVNDAKTKENKQKSDDKSENKGENQQKEQKKEHKNQNKKTDSKSNSKKEEEESTVDQKNSKKDGGDNNQDTGNNKKSKKNQRNESQSSDSDYKKLTQVSPNLEENIKFLKLMYHIPLNKDVIIREFNVAQKIPAFVIFVDGMIDSAIINEFLLPELMYIPLATDLTEGCPLNYVEKNVITLNQIEHMKTFKEINQQILSGLTVLFIDGCQECLVIESRGFDRRSVGPPFTETVVNGAQEGFTETLRTNITLIRRIIKNENLITEFNFVSKTNNFLCAIMYIDDITNPRMVKEVKRRVKSLDIDYISGSGMLEQLIEDKPHMLFPQTISTERPDRVASFLMDGKVALICEGTPFAMAMPITFFDLYHTSEESNLRNQYGTFLRIIRLIGLLIAALLPGMYTALILFHQEMIPTALLFAIVASRATVPFPTIIEILLMEFSFELIREGGIRVPGITGNTLGIIGALIMGQAAVSAGLVSPILIIVVAISGLGSFAIPNYSLSLAVRIIRFMFIVFGFLGGFYGISSGFTILMALALSMRSFGVPFFAPMSPTTRSNKDKVIRGTIQQQQNRPDYLNPINKKRMSDNPRGWTNSSKGGSNTNAEGE